MTPFDPIAAPCPAGEPAPPCCPIDSAIADCAWCEGMCELCGAWYYHLEGHVCAEKPSEQPPITKQSEGEIPNNEIGPGLSFSMNQSAAVIIGRHHQSAPKDHWADKVMREAAQDIVDGKVEGQGAGEDFFHYGQTQTVLGHPRVQDALRKLETEMEASHNTQEALEKSAMYHELNEQYKSRVIFKR